MMLSESKIAEVKRLLASGMTHRRIAALACLSHGSVAAIASGKRIERPAQSQNYPFPMTYGTVRARAREMLIANGREKNFSNSCP